LEVKHCGRGPAPRCQRGNSSAPEWYRYSELLQCPEFTHYCALEY
jgi:hypothetical protein